MPGQKCTSFMICFTLPPSPHPLLAETKGEAKKTGSHKGLKPLGRMGPTGCHNHSVPINPSLGDFTPLLTFFLLREVLFHPIAAHYS